ncbi:MAG: hypothetical protein ACI9R3_001885 [Verrucomicrobiales bacterium]|jgi:hypothetical protein
MEFMSEVQTLKLRKVPSIPDGLTSLITPLKALAKVLFRNNLHKSACLFGHHPRWILTQIARYHR